MKTILSAGLALQSALESAVGGMATAVFPVLADKAALPYVCYQRTSASPTPTSGGAADSCTVEVAIYSKGYAEGVALAEAVRAELDMARGNCGGLQVRGCRMVDATEGWAGDCFEQRLIFEIRI